jgi:hypothetical protein
MGHNMLTLNPAWGVAVVGALFGEPGRPSALRPERDPRTGKDDGKTNVIRQNIAVMNRSQMSGTLSTADQ